MGERGRAVNRRRTPIRRHAAAVAGFTAFTLAAAFALVARAGTPPWPREAPECWLRITVAQPGKPVLDVDGWMQYGHTDSVDLRLSVPGLAHWARLEAHVAAEALVLHPRAATGAYRAEVPRGALLQWVYPAAFATAESLPQSFGPEHACAYLGGFALAPERADHAAVAAAERWFVDATLPPGWRALGPWNARDGHLRPRDRDDLQDNFAGWGLWRTHSVVAGACTLQVAAAAGLSDSLGTSCEALLGQQFGAGRSLVLLVPGPAPRAFVAARSALVRVVPGAGPRAGFDAAWAVRRPVRPVPPRSAP